MLGWAWTATLALAVPLPLRAASAVDVAQALRAASGRPRVVHVWASGCMPCVAELPLVVAELRRAEKRGFDVVVLSLDAAGGEPEAEKLLRKAGWAQGVGPGPAGQLRKGQLRGSQLPLWLSLRAASPQA